MDMEQLYGKQGIDTAYEREKVTYRPNIYLPEKDRYYKINPSVLIKIERAKDFTISKSIIDYDALIARIDELMLMIKDRHTDADFKAYFGAVESGVHKDIDEAEAKLSGHRGSPDAEIYTLLHRMRLSIEGRKSFLDRYYRNQITEDRNIDDLQHKEMEAIDEWVHLELKFIEIEEKIQQLYDEHSHEESIEAEIEQQLTLLEQELNASDRAKQRKSVFHTSLADTSYIHRNRYVMFSNIVDRMEKIIKNPQNLLKGNLTSFMMQLSTLQDISAAKSHLILAFRELKQKHASLKGQFMMIDDQKEDFISKQQWIYQQIEVKANGPLSTWLYNQDEDAPEAFHLFADILANSMKKSSDQFVGSNAELLRFYQQEAVLYDDQISLIQKKEEIRRFLQILEDLEAAGVITEEWTVEYLKGKGYAVS